MSDPRYKRNILVHMARTDLVNIKSLLDLYSIDGKTDLHMDNFAQTYEIIRNAWKNNINVRRKI